MILAVDTSLPLLTVALIDDGALLAAMAEEGEGSRNEKLLPLIDAVLGAASRQLSDVTLFAVTRGPGSFTGTRVGLATVQGMAIGLGRPVCAMSTHEAAAWAIREGEVVVSSDAGRGERYLSMFRDGEPSGEPRLATASELAAVLARMPHVDLDERGERNVAALLGAKAGWLQSRGALARYQDMAPLYVRLAEAEVKLRARDV